MATINTNYLLITPLDVINYIVNKTFNYLTKSIFYKRSLKLGISISKINIKKTQHYIFKTFLSFESKTSFFFNVFS